MADPATPAARDNEPTASVSDEEPQAPNGPVQRSAPDLQWRPVWRGDEPDEIDQLLAPGQPDR